MQRLKKYIINHLSETRLAHIALLLRYQRKYKSSLKLLLFGIKSIFLFYAPSGALCKGEQVKKLFSKVKIKITDEDKFVYNIDVYKTIYRKNKMIENISIDYSKVLNESLKDMRQRISKLNDSEYKKNELLTIDAIETYINREIKAIQKSNRNDKKEVITYLENIKNNYPNSFKEAIQRVLFYNQLLWQSGHVLMGLGELDRILYQYYNSDIKNKIITKDDAKDIICDMLYTLHKYYWWKSNSLPGDTGQIIILGGMKNNKEYYCNDLTYLFIEAMKEARVPDPKVLLRVSNNVPRDLMELSLECIKTGIGCPLFSNDEVVIPKLIKFGIDKEDAYNYVTSACWEPLIASKSLDQNNIDSIVFLHPLNQMLEEENLSKIKTFHIFLNKYYYYLEKYLIHLTNEINEIVWEKDSLLSLFIEKCDDSLKDVSEGGAIYNHYGLTGVSLGNTVNSIYNIKHFVYDLKKYNLNDLNSYRKDNFVGHEEVLNEMKNQPIRYGVENEEIIYLTNQISSHANEIVDKISNRFGGKFKFGFSAPTYIVKSADEPASFDGRKNGEAFGVHISSDKSSLAYTELIQFASKLDYSGHRFNGNVTDFIITPSFIEDNFDKMVDFLILSIKLGFFQMQMNVVSSETLINAKKNPKDYEGLIVRVWGFSAYFNDLPDTYKDLLIERALKNEGKS